MRFLALTTPAALMLLALVAAAIVALYLLKPSPRRIAVASSLVWARVLRARRRDPERLRWWLSLLLALTIGLALAAALTRPELAALSGAARDVVLVIDNSLTMAARTADGSTRWEHAVAQAREVIGAAGSGGRFLLADTHGAVSGAAFQDRDAALAALAALRVAPGAALFPMLPATDAGTSAAQRILITDGVSRLAAPPGFEIRSAFEPADNAGITAFDARAQPGDPRRIEALVEVHNASPARQRIELELQGAGGRPIVRTLDIPGRRALAEVLDVSGFAGGPLRASISSAGDALDIDNTAYAYLPGRRVLRVALVTPGNPHLEQALRRLPRARVTVLHPGQSVPGFDAFVYDRTAPQSPLPGAALLFAPGPADWLPRRAPQTRELAVGDWDARHPVTAGVSLRDVVAESAAPWRSPGAGIEVLASGQNRTALIVAAESRPRWIGVAFALENSNFVQQPGFPLFVDNALDWLAGEPTTLARSPGIVEVPLPAARVLGLDGEQRPVHEFPGATSFDAAQPGLFTAVSGEQRLRVAVNLLDFNVSDINRSALVPFAAEAATMTRHSWRMPVDTWLALLVLASLLLAAEAWTYHQRLTV